jgi:hypothetical protein
VATTIEPMKADAIRTTARSRPTMNTSCVIESLNAGTVSSGPFRGNKLVAKGLMRLGVCTIVYHAAALIPAPRGPCGATLVFVQRFAERERWRKPAGGAEWALLR